MWSLVSAVLVTATVAQPTVAVRSDEVVPGEAVARGDETAPNGASDLERFEFARPRIGTIVNATVYCRGEARANEAIRAAFNRLDELNRILSDYEPESELNRLVKTSGPGRPVEVSAPLFHVLSEAQRLSEATDGAFDVTVGPLTKLWRTTYRRKQLPEPDVLAKARAAVGWRHVTLDSEDRTVELAKPGTRLDLGGIAKGYIADEMLRVLREHGITRAMIDAGGDLVVGDPPPGRKAWRIQIEGLDPKGPPRFLDVANAGVATSGDLYRAVEIDGVRYSHIVDPRTGLGLTTRSSVTVVAPNGLLADAHASALSVLGPQKGLALAEKACGIEASIASDVDGTVRVGRTEGFPLVDSPR